MSDIELGPLEAAKLLLDHREQILLGEVGDTLARISVAGTHVDAGITKTRRVLIITGSDSWQDYMFYNLRPWRPLPNVPEIDRLCRDFPEQAFHRGFLLHAARVLSFVGDEIPEYIVGHSLGAAAAQILGTALRVPTIALASPQVIKRRFLEPEPVRRRDHPQWNVFNIVWAQDFVTRGYRMAGMRALGHRTVVDFEHRNPGIDHFVEHYRDLVIADTLSPTPRLPNVWPDPTHALPTRLA